MTAITTVLAPDHIDLALTLVAHLPSLRYHYAAACASVFHIHFLPSLIFLARFTAAIAMESSPDLIAFCLSIFAFWTSYSVFSTRYSGQLP